MTADFVHLRVHSAYSLSEGAIKLPQLVELAASNEMPAVAVTDTGNLFGALEFADYATNAGVQPIIGTVLGLARPDTTDPHAAPDRIVLLVKDETGYRNLLKLVSHAFLETESGRTPCVDDAYLAAHADGLICLSGGIDGPVGRLLGEAQKGAALERLQFLKATYGDCLYVELQRHGWDTEDRIEGALIEFAYAEDLPLVATNDVYFGAADMHEAHDALICIAEGAYVAQRDRRRLSPEHWFKPAAAMRDLFADLPEAVDNTLVIARRCAYMPEPVAPILPRTAKLEGHSEEEALRALAAEGLETRLRTKVFTEEQDEAARAEIARPYRERLEEELGIILQMGFAGYFLIVADFIQWAKEQDIPVGPGRGSGAGSVVAWALTITDLDPLRWGLLFERFLNPERVSMPDFDIDFCQDRRDEVIRYVQREYGADRVAQIITFGKLQARAVLRDVGRVLEMPYGQVDRISKLVPNNPANPVTLQQAIDGEEQLRTMIREDEAVARLVDIALKLEGLYRHASTHAAGVVIGDRPLDELIPLYRDPRSDMPVTEFNMKWVEQAGLVKFDFLGLKTLTVLQRAVELIHEVEPGFDLETIPLDDPPTYEMLGRGDATGVFQLESSGMRDVLRKLKPDRFEDIIAVVALYRPGPMDNIPSYIRRKHGQEEADHLHPSLQPILRETHGIMIYQEQVMQIAQVLSGYSLGAADLLRRAMGKKIQAEMDAQRKSFVEGAVANDVEEGRAAMIFDQVAKFAGYGFNKSHAAAYALVGYQTAYLKANYPVEFFAALMTLDLNNTDKLNAFRQELQRLAIPVLPPDVNASREIFGVERRGDGSAAVRYALAAIRNVGRGAMAALTQEREANGPFASLSDFAARVDPTMVNKRQLENLARAGAFDTLEPNRARVLAGADLLLREASAAANERASNQESLFGDGDIAQELRLPDTPAWDGLQQLQEEFNALGFYLSAHPLDAYEKALTRLGAVRSTELAARIQANGGNARFVVAGTVISKQERTSARGNRFAFVQLSDPDGVFEITCFSEVLGANRDRLEPGQAVLVTVDGRSDGDQARLLAQRIEALDEAAAKAAMGLRVYIEDAAALAPLKSVLAREPQGRGRITLVLDLEDAQEVEMTLPGALAVDGRLRSAVKAIAGVVEVHDV